MKAPALLAKPSLRRSWTDSEGIRGAAAEVIAASDFVEGWVLTPTMGTSAQPDAREEKRAKFKAAAMFKLKLQQADKIEGYPHLYQRSVVTAEIREDGEPPSQGKKHTVQAYIYHKPDCKRGHRIPSGDWLKRGEQQPNVAASADWHGGTSTPTFGFGQRVLEIAREASSPRGRLLRAASSSSMDLDDDDDAELEELLPAYF